MNNNTFGVSKKSLAMKLYGMLIDEDAVDLQESPTKEVYNP